MGVCYAVTIGIRCEICEKKEKQLHQSTKYESKMLVKMDWNTKEQRDEHRKAQPSLNHDQRMINVN